MKCLVDARTVLLVTLALVCAILLAAGSALYGLHASQKIRHAYDVITRADSLQRDWIGRGCAPRSKALP